MGKKNRALRDKNKNILTLVNETKIHNPPFKLNGRSVTNHPKINKPEKLLIQLGSESLFTFYGKP